MVAREQFNHPLHQRLYSDFLPKGTVAAQEVSSPKDLQLTHARFCKESGVSFLLARSAASHELRTLLAFSSLGFDL